MQKDGLRTRLRRGIENFGLAVDRILAGSQPLTLAIPDELADRQFVPAAAIVRRLRDTNTESLHFRNESGDRTVSIRRNDPSPSSGLPARRMPAAMVDAKERASTDVASLRPYAGRRISMENPALMGNGLEIMAQFSRSEYWQQTTLSSRFNTDNFSKISITDLAELLTELSPEVSAALWYYLLCCNSGYEINVYKPGTETTYEEAKKYLMDSLAKLGRYHGTLNTYFDKTFMAIFLRGSFLYELVLAKNGKDFVDLAAPDPKTLHFRRQLDPERGQIWDFGQYQNGEFVSLNIPTVRYVPLHPFPGSIVGRPMISPVFFTSIFLMSVLRDLKRVIQQQGYMRLDLKVMFEKLKDQMPEDAQGDPSKVKAWSDGVIGEIMDFYAQLEADDAFVHSDAVEMGAPVGTASSNSLQAMDALFKLLERMACRGLKTLPSLLGMEDHGNQASDNRKFEFYQKGNETIQRMVETGFGDECKLILQARGFQADVSVQFAQMRASEELRDAQIDLIKSKIAAFWYDRGWYSQDEAAKLATGKDAADQEEPRDTGGDLNVGGTAQLQPDPGANRFGELSDFLRTPTLAELNHARELWEANAPDEAKSLINAMPAE